MLPLALGAAALLLLFGGGKAAAKAPPKPKPPRGVVTLGPVSVIKTAPKPSAKSAAKTASPKPSGSFTPKPKPKQPAATLSRTLSAPLATSPSQGGSPSLAPPLSADIPTDTLSPSAPRPGPTPRSQPPGYNPDVARRSAPSIANHLKRAGKANYDRKLLAQFQTQAGLKPDKLYGPGTRGALVFFGAKDAPPAFTGSGTTPYKPPV